MRISSHRVTSAFAGAALRTGSALRAVAFPRTKTATAQTGSRAAAAGSAKATAAQATSAATTTRMAAAAAAWQTTTGPPAEPVAFNAGETRFAGQADVSSIAANLDRGAAPATRILAAVAPTSSADLATVRQRVRRAEETDNSAARTTMERRSYAGPLSCAPLGAVSSAPTAVSPATPAVRGTSAIPKEAATQVPADASSHLKLQVLAISGANRELSSLRGRTRGRSRWNASLEVDDEMEQ
jgi:hypothetical protein